MYLPPVHHMLIFNVGFPVTSAVGCDYTPCVVLVYRREKQHSSSMGRKPSKQSKFGVWATKSKLKNAAIGAQLGIGEKYVSRLRCAVETPGPDLAGRIHELTDGEVSMGDWGK
jgi:hypothetical protein